MSTNQAPAALFRAGEKCQEIKFAAMSSHSSATADESKKSKFPELENVSTHRSKTTPKKNHKAVGKNEAVTNKAVVSDAASSETDSSPGNESRIKGKRQALAVNPILLKRAKTIILANKSPMVGEPNEVSLMRRMILTPKMNEEERSDVKWFRNHELQMMGAALKSQMVAKVDEAIREYLIGSIVHQTITVAWTNETSKYHTNRLPSMEIMAQTVLDDIGSAKELAKEAETHHAAFSSVQEWRDYNRMRHEYLVRCKRDNSPHNPKKCYFCDVEFGPKSNNGAASHANTFHIISPKKYPCRVDGCSKWFSAVYLEELHQELHSRPARPGTNDTVDEEDEDDNDVEPPSSNKSKSGTNFKTKSLIKDKTVGGEQGRATTRSVSSKKPASNQGKSRDPPTDYGNRLIITDKKVKNTKDFTKLKQKPFKAKKKDKQAMAKQKIRSVKPKTQCKQKPPN